MINQKHERQKYLLGKLGSTKLNKAHIAVYGLGGSGSPIALQLAYLGIGHISLIDPDIIEESNLNRQLLYNRSDIGTYKVDAAKNRIEQVDKNISVETELLHDKALLEKKVNTYTIVVDATDDYRFKVLLDRTCRSHNIPMIHTSAVGLRGTVVTFCDQSSSYEKLYELPTLGRNIEDVSNDEFEKRRQELIPLLVGDFYPPKVMEMLQGNEISWQTLVPAPTIAGGVAVVEIIRTVLGLPPMHPPSNPFNFNYQY